METVRIRRQFSDYRIGEIHYGGLNGICWDNISGGVYDIAPQPFIHAYVLCNEVKGDIAHSCQHGPPPHNIKIVILKKDNTQEIYKRLLESAGPRPIISRAKPYRANADVKEICNALLQGEEHPAIEIKNHKTHGKIFVIKPKNIKRLTETGTENTIRSRAKKVKSEVKATISKYSNFIHVQYGYWPSYKKMD